MKKLRRCGNQGGLISRLLMQGKSYVESGCRQGGGDLEEVEGRGESERKREGEKEKQRYAHTRKVLYDNHRSAVPQADDGRKS